MRLITGWGANDWLTVVMICSTVIALILHVEKHALWAEGLNVLAGLIGLYLLFWMTKPWLVCIWNSAVGKIGLGFFSLLVIAGARTLADAQITYTIGVSASLFPRAQDLLTLFFSFILWFLLAFLILGLSTIVTKIYFFLMLFAGDVVESAKPRRYPALKLFLSIFVVSFGMAALTERVDKFQFGILERAIVWSSFVPNQAMKAFGRSAPAIPDLCSSEPKDALLAFTGDGAVMVALPATSDASARAFTYRWGQCGHEGEERQKR